MTVLRYALLFVMLLTVGCSVGPDYEPPKIETPDVWHQQLVRGLHAGGGDLRDWWKVFNDPQLDDLMARAGESNLTLRQAVYRIEEAQAFLGIARGEYFPDIDATGDASRFRLSESTAPIPPAGSRTDWLFGFGGDLLYEIDLWGRVRRNVESADANFQATVEDYRDVMVVLYAQVASSYIEIRTLQERIRLAEENVKSQRGTLKLTTTRFKAEIAPELDVVQADSNLANTESVVPSLRISLARAVNRLAVLLGTYPDMLAVELAAPKVLPKPLSNFLVGVPADLLRQRPDVRRAERLLAAQNAQIGVATADLYPRFSLFGDFGFDAVNSFGDVFESGSRAYAFGSGFRWNIFDGGRVRNNIKAQDARTKQLLVEYEDTVLRAVEDVENAMVSYSEENNRRDVLTRGVKSTARSVELVRGLYTNGLTNFQNVLDNERSLVSQQDRLAESEGAICQSLIQLYRALGGGWGAEEEGKESSN